MNLYEVTLHGTDSIYLLASTKHRRPGTWWEIT